jgi:hypothetical protein
MSIVTNTDYSSIDATSILLMKLMREQQSSASKKVVPMVNFEDYQSTCLSVPAPIDSIRAVCSPSTSNSTGIIGNWLKESKVYDEKHASLLLGGELRKASTTQQSRQRKGFPLAATKNRSLVKPHSMRRFRAQWSNGASRGDQHVNREVFARRLQRGTLLDQELLTADKGTCS